MQLFYCFHNDDLLMFMMYFVRVYFDKRPPREIRFYLIRSHSENQIKSAIILSACLKLICSINTRGDPELTSLPLYLFYVMHVVIKTFYKYASIYTESKDKQKYFCETMFSSYSLLWQPIDMIAGQVSILH